MTPRNRRKAAKRNKQYRLARKAAGACGRYNAARAPDRAMCARHLEEARANDKTYKARKRAGIVAITRKASSPEYTPIEVLFSAPRTRLLRGMRWLDWSSLGEVLDVIGVPNEGHSIERNTVTAMLGRLVREGFIERRGQRNGYEYTLSATGRAEADRIRNGDVSGLKAPQIRRAA